jgi:hypothetical protein
MTARNFWVTFTSSLRAEDADEPHPKGYAIGKRLHSGLARSGIRCEGVDNWRDVGYSIDCLIDEKRVYVFFSLLGRPLQQWALCCTSDLGWISRLRGKQDDDQRLKLAQAVDAVLNASDEFSNVRWYKQWRGDEDAAWIGHPE